MKKRMTLAMMAALAALIVAGWPQAAAAACACDGEDALTPPFEPWVFGHFVWFDESTSASVLQLVRDYRDRGVPVDGVIIDSPWETAYNTFDPDPTMYPDLKALIAELHDQNVKVIMWITSVVNTEDPEYQLGLDHGYFVKGMEKTKWWKGTGGMIDYDNPAAVAWWHQRMNKIIDLGIDGWKCDGTDPFMLLKGFKARERYATAYYSDFYRYTRERSGRKTLIMARPLEQVIDENLLKLPAWMNPLGLGVYLKFAPVQVSYMSWVGDEDPTFDGLAIALRRMLESDRKNYLIVGSDVGGYRDGGPSKEVLIRWAQLGAFSPYFENGGIGEHRPWLFDDETLAIYRASALIHQALGPYFMDTAVARWREGRSMVSPMPGQQGYYLLGPDLFVAGITRAGGKKKVVLPKEGNWVPLFKEVIADPAAQRCLVSAAAGQALKPGCAFTHTYSLAAYPIFVRAGVESPFQFKGEAFAGLKDMITEGLMK
jgi:alpha-glucosidase (family GH31 glycosyl hydrolase)